MTRPGRAVLQLGRVEAARSMRHLYTLVGLLGAAIIVVLLDRQIPVRWWIADSGLGTAMLAPAAAALATAQLASSRARRDGLDQLYSSFPTSSSHRRVGHLLAVLGPTALAGALCAVAAAWLSARGATGAPSPAVLLGAVLLVLLGGTFGVALGTWLPHAAAGLLAMLLTGAAEALVVLNFQSAPLVPARWALALPWSQPAVLPDLPAAVPDLMRSSAHAIELTGLVAVAVALTLARRRRRGLAVVAAVLALAVVGASAWWQSQPVPSAQLDSLVRTATDPAAVQRCADGSGGVRYCAYPRYAGDLTQWSEVVDGVLSRAPGGGRGLVVRQVSMADFLSNSPVLTDGIKPGDVEALRSNLSAFLNRLLVDPHAVPGSSNPPVYISLSWRYGGPAEFELALAVARWAVGLPTTAIASDGPPSWCVPSDQAREAVALWLAALATPETSAAFVRGRAGPVSATLTSGGTVATLALVDESENAAVVNATADNAQLAFAMTSLPPGQVERVLVNGWSRWLNPATTSESLASALGLTMPRVAVPSAVGTEPGAAAGQPVVRPRCSERRDG